jgi:hypothetical protein
MKGLPYILLVLILVSISINLTAGPLITSENRTLDGNVYATILNGKNDLLTFRNGSFQSNFYAERGYDKGEYATVTKANSIWFEAKTANPLEGEIFWKGVIEGNAINGSYLYTTKGWFIFGDTTKKKNFKGSLKAKEKF